MKSFVLIVLMNQQMVTQEFFGETACKRALFELKETSTWKSQAARSNLRPYEAFCTPKHIKVM